MQVWNVLHVARWKHRTHSTRKQHCVRAHADSTVSQHTHKQHCVRTYTNSTVSEHTQTALYQSTHKQHCVRTHTNSTVSEESCVQWKWLTDLEVVPDERQLFAEVIISFQHVAHFHPSNCLHCPGHRRADVSQKLHSHTIISFTDDTSVYWYINAYVDSFDMSNSTHQFLNSIRPFSYLAEKLWELRCIACKHITFTIYQIQPR